MAGIYVAQTYKVPNINDKCEGMRKCCSDKYQSFRNWEKNQRK